jgi:pimeloyl-ACP methyl ester carboxylesterase
VHANQGPDTVRGAVRRRFGSDRWSAEDTSLIADYLYHITAGKASGEYAMNSLLKPVISQAIDTENPTATHETRRTTGVYAREPVTPVKFKESYQASSKNPPPVLIVYGDHDWLRFPSVGKYVEDMNRNGIDAAVVTIPQAGHHLYLDNAPKFHQEVFDWLEKKA